MDDLLTNVQVTVTGCVSFSPTQINPISGAIWCNGDPFCKELRGGVIGGQL